MLLTAATTVLGLTPMVIGVNVDLLTPSLGIGAPSTQWWTELSSAIAGGLTFATMLTLILTPCMLVLGDRIFTRLRKKGIEEHEEPHPASNLAELRARKAKAGGHRL